MGDRPGFELRPRRRLSQNFLVDAAIAGRIVAAFAPDAADHVVEVGPGGGVLTDRLAGRAARLLAIEVDPRLAARLALRLEAEPSVAVLARDVLAVPLAELRAGPRLRLISNLPYGISSPFLLKLLDEADEVRDALLLLQLEFAARLAAPPGGGDYGSLSVLAQSRLRIRRLFDVPPSAFRPRPSVVSSLVHLEPLAEPLVGRVDWAALLRVLRVAFAGRRKTLANALARGLGIGRDEAAALLLEAGIEPGVRAETVEPERWARLARSLPAELRASERSPAGGADI